MRIDPNQGVAAGQSTDSVQVGKQSSSQAAQTSSQVADPQDRASFSSDAQHLSTLSTALSNVPDVRQSRVDALRQAVQGGTYNPSNTDIAQALLRDTAATSAR
jgi:flagellar biosynthesis anti-sigma factor FlgM